jgi:crotonobetainyl-CoA:carnitine CoA-transferase CaiB-like acyl-CoA transferase
MNEALEHEHTKVREAFTPIPHPARDDVRVTASPYHVDGAPVPARGAAPYRAGEHTRAVLGETLGYSAGRIDALVASGAVAVPR